MKKTSITTKKGDAGQTSLLGRKRVTKHDPRPEAYGTVDEAAAFLGLARAKSDLSEVKNILKVVQNHLYLINSELACPPEQKHLLKRTLNSHDLEELEKFAAEIESKVELPAKFVLYGETETSAYLDVARTIVRRAERRITELASQEGLANRTIVPYINRLSDMLFLLARYEEFVHHVPYAHPLQDK